MIASLFAAIAVLSVQEPRADTTVFVTPAVRALVERATARRRTTDSAVADYQATVHYRLSFGFGRRQWARVPPVVVEEQIAQVQWRVPNDLRLDIVGRRSAARSDG